MRRTMLAVVAALGAGCQVPGLKLTVESPMAVGATSAVMIKRCGAVAPDRGDGCEAVTLRSLASEDPSVVSVIEGSGGLLAHAPGLTTLTVVVDQGEELQATVEARRVDQIELVHLRPLDRCPRDGPRHYPTGHPLDLDVVLRGGGEALWGKRTLQDLFEVRGGTVSGEVSVTVAGGVNRVASFILRPTPGDGSISSPVDPALSIPITSYGLEAVTGIEVAPLPAEWNPTATTNSGKAVVWLDLSVGGVTSCTDTFSRLVTVSTPGVCSLLADDDSNKKLNELQVKGPRVILVSGTPGTCEVSVSLDGTGHTASRAFTVVAR